MDIKYLLAFSFFIIRGIFTFFWGMLEKYDFHTYILQTSKDLGGEKNGPNLSN
jgi:hypothetical protein